MRWLHADLLDGVPDEFDAILANLPYVADSERATLAPEILRHEPASALFAGPDGLERDPRAARASGRAARVRRSLAIEVGAGQAARVERADARGPASTSVRSERDLAGIERVIVAQR